MDFDIQGFFEGVLSGALSAILIKLFIFAVVAVGGVWALVSLVKSGIEAAKNRAFEYARKLRDEEESRLKLIDWNQLQDRQKENMARAFQRVKEEKAARGKELRATSIEMLSPTGTLNEKVTKTREKFTVLKERKGRVGSTGQKQAFDLILDVFTTQKGKDYTLRVGQPEGNPLSEEQFFLIVENILSNGQYLQFTEEGFASGSKSIYGHKINFSAEKSDQSLHFSWEPKTITTVEKVEPENLYDLPELGKLEDMVPGSNDDPYGSIISTEIVNYDSLIDMDLDYKF